MIRSLRSRHRILWLLLAVVVGPLLAAGLLSRRPVPTVPPPVPGAELVGVDPDIHRTRIVQSVRGKAFQLTLWREGGRIRAAIETYGSMSHPELLIYWSTSPAGSGWDPAAGRLLGRLAGSYPTRFDLPPGDGYLVLYSLVQREPVSVIESPAFVPGEGAGG